MNHRPRQRPRFRFAGFLALLVLVVGWSVHGVAQPSADEFSLLDLMPAAAAASEGAPESPQWCNVSHDTPQGEVSALEAEPDGEPVAPDLPGIIRPVFGCTAKVTTTGQVLHGATETYTIRFAASPVLARAPPRGAR